MDRVVPVAVKAMPLEAYRRQLRIGDGDATRVLAARSSSDRTRSPDRLCVEPMRLTTVAKSTSGVPRQFIAMCENNRCSILFHLLVPGGK